MKSLYLKEEFDKAKSTLRYLQKTAINNEKLAPILASYFLIFICGTYENAIEHLFVQRAGKTGDKEIENFIKEIMDRYFRSPSYEKINELVRMLKGKEYKIKLDPRNISELGYLVRNRKDVAHGKYSNATLTDCASWHRNVVKIFEELENILL